MLFCTSCKRLLTRDTTSGKIVLNCTCGKQYKGEDEDTLLYSNYKTTSDKTNAETVLQFAGKDRVNQLVDIECTQCRMPYMTLASIDVNFWLICGKCNYKIEAKKANRVKII